VLIREVNSDVTSIRTVASQFSAGDNHGKFVVEEESEAGL
jgi:hypothetical protein